MKRARPSRHFRGVWTRLGRRLRLINPFVSKKRRFSASVVASFQKSMTYEDVQRALAKEREKERAVAMARGTAFIRRRPGRDERELEELEYQISKRKSFGAFFRDPKQLRSLQEEINAEQNYDVKEAKVDVLRAMGLSKGFSTSGEVEVVPGEKLEKEDPRSTAVLITRAFGRSGRGAGFETVQERKAVQDLLDQTTDPARRDAMEDVLKDLRLGRETKRAGFLVEPVLTEQREIIRGGHVQKKEEGGPKREVAFLRARLPTAATFVSQEEEE